MPTSLPPRKPKGEIDWGCIYAITISIAVYVVAYFLFTRLF